MEDDSSEGDIVLPPVERPTRARKAPTRPFFAKRTFAEKAAAHCAKFHESDESDDEPAPRPMKPVIQSIIKRRLLREPYHIRCQSYSVDVPTKRGYNIRRDMWYSSSDTSSDSEYDTQEAQDWIKHVRPYRKHNSLLSYYRHQEQQPEPPLLPSPLEGPEQMAQKAVARAQRARTRSESEAISPAVEDVAKLAISHAAADSYQRKLIHRGHLQSHFYKVKVPTNDPPERKRKKVMFYMSSDNDEDPEEKGWVGETLSHDSHLYLVWWSRNEKELQQQQQQQQQAASKKNTRKTKNNKKWNE